MTKIEQETIINFNDAEDIAYVSTRQKRVMNLFERLGIEPNHNQADYRCYVVPSNWIGIRPPRKASKKQIEAGRNNLLKALKK